MTGNSYDGFGNLKSSTVTVSGVPRTVSSLYDLDNNRTQLTHPDNQAFTYAYDARDRLSGLYQGIGTATPLDTFAYNADDTLNQRSEASAGASGTANYTYDAIGRLASQSDAYPSFSGSNVSWTFTLSPASQIASESRNNDAYAYGGLLTVNRDYGVNGLNQYTAAGSAAFTYDSNGNLTGDGTNAYIYDGENRLVSATAAGVTTTLSYDPLGRLWQVIKGAANTRFLYDGDASVVEYSSGAVVNRYVHGSNAAADDPLVWYVGAGLTTKRYLHADHLGSIVGITNASAAPSINKYDEYGVPGSANTGRFQYTGQAWIGELGMYYYKARMYSATLGRFLQTDPVGYKGGINIYEYALNDPVNLGDPAGLASDCTGSQICNGEGLSSGVSGSSTASPTGNSATVAPWNQGDQGSSSQGGQEASQGPSDIQLAGLGDLLQGDHDFAAGPNLICPASWGCSEQLVGSVYSQVRNGIPGNNSSAPIVSGNTYTVRLFGVPIGQVKSYVGAGGLTVSNETRWNHVLASGWANRNAYQSRGNWYSFTHGRGTNYYGGVFMAVPNQLSGPAIFNSLDASIRNQLYEATH